MKAGGNLDRFEAELRRAVTPQDLEQVRFLQDAAVSREAKERAYVELQARPPGSLSALVLAFMPLLRSVTRLRRSDDAVAEFCELVVAGVPLHELRGRLLNALRHRKQPLREEPTIEPDIAAILDVHEAIERGVISEDEYDLLQAYWMYGRAAPDLAIESGLTPEACKKRVQRATRALRDHLRHPHAGSA